jgi:hypothetical protein
MLALGDVSLMAAIGLFIGAAAVIGVPGVRLAALADRLADRTGLGEAVSGALFLGASTSEAPCCCCSTVIVLDWQRMLPHIMRHNTLRGDASAG